MPNKGGGGRVQLIWAMCKSKSYSAKKSVPKGHGDQQISTIIVKLCAATQLSAAAFLDIVVYCSGCAELWVGGECGILPDGLVAPPAPWPGSVSGPHWLAAAPRTPSLLSQACPSPTHSPNLAHSWTVAKGL